MKGSMKNQIWQAFTIAVILSFGIPAGQAHAGDAPASLSAAEIIKQAAAKYASLKSYSDEGATASKLGNLIAASYTFNIKLARSNLYQVIWWEPDQVYTPKGVVWSAGNGNFLWMGKSFTKQKCADQERALASATGISGGVAANIPGTFFKMNWGNQLGVTADGARRKADEKIGDVDCFVLTHGAGGRTNILWIGKNDFLIHQVENDTSAALLKRTLEEQAKKNPQIRTLLETAGSQMFQDSKTVETHRHIVINPLLTATDFDYHVPAVPPH